MTGGAEGTETGYVSSKDGTRLFYRWRPADDAAGAVVVVHGFGEHSGRYGHVQEALAARGLASVAFDYRGFGRADGQRAFVLRFADYLDDVARAVAFSRERAPGLPTFLLGHSQGGLVAALYAIERPDGLAGSVLTSPAFGASVRIPAWKDGLARVLSGLVPRFSLPTGIPSDGVSRDPEVVRAYDEDPLRARVATARWYTELLSAQARAMEGAPRLSMPVLVIQAGADRLVSPDASERWTGLVGSDDRRFVRWPGLYHEVMNEPEKGEVLAEIGAWIEERTRERTQRGAPAASG